MDGPTTGNGLPPLDQIRQIEAEITRRVATKRVSVGRSIEQARMEARQLVRQAREAGEREGQARYQAIIRQADEEARAIVERSHQLANEIRARGNLNILAAVDKVVSVVAGLSEESQEMEADQLQ